MPAKAADGTCLPCPTLSIDDLYIGVAGASAAGIAADARVLSARRASLARVIVDNDFAGDPDGRFQLAHHLLCASIRISLVFV